MNPTSKTANPDDGYRRMAVAVIEDAIHSVRKYHKPALDLDDQDHRLIEAMDFLCGHGLRCHGVNPWFFHEMAGVDSLAEMDPDTLLQRLLTVKYKCKRSDRNHNANCSRWRSSRGLPPAPKRRAL